MKLVSCYVDGFGALRSARVDFDDGLTVFSSGNGVGKTTLASFLKAMFYGLPSCRSNSKAFDDRRRYCPFDGGTFGGSVTFEAGGSVYRVERFFDKKSGQRDELRIYKGGKLTKELSPDVGEKLFGLNAESFSRTVYMDAAEVESGASADILNKLEGGSASSDADADGAFAALDGKIRSLRAARGSGGLIDRTEADVAKIRDEIARLEVIEKGLEQKYDERARLERGSSADNVSAEEKTTSKRGVRPNAFLISLALILVAGGAALCVVSLWGIALVALGVTALAATLYPKLRAKPDLSSGGESRQQRGEKPVDRRLGELDAGIALDEAELEALPACRTELLKIQSRLQNLKRRHELLCITRRCLEESGEKVSVKYIFPVREGFMRYAKTIRAALGGNLVMAEDFSVKFERGGALTDERHLSAGQRCVCGLCLRLALIDNMFGREKPFLIMDDPFITLDSENMNGVRRVVQELAKDRQIIYFTCHETREV